MWGMLVALVAAPFPDEINIVKIDGEKPRMNLILDSSCSMGFTGQTTNCTWFASNQNGGNRYLTLNGQMRAVLVGCQTKGDGILDKWHNTVDFAIHDFRGVRADYGSSLSQLRAAAIGIPASGGTPLTMIQRQAGEYMNAESDETNTESCQSYFHLLLSDGNPNGSSDTLRQDCTSPVENLWASSRTPWVSAEYLFSRHPDVLCDVPGNQTITTYTLGFGPPGWFNPIYLQRTAADGGGVYYYASSVPELIGAFDSIMGSVAAEKQSLIQIAIGQDNFFSANRSYGVNFETELNGPWKGNIRRMCIFPPKLSSGQYDTSVTSCLLKSTDGEALLTNPNAVDLWTGQQTDGTTLGGAGEVMRVSLGTSTPSAPYWTKRNLVTWRAGEASWVPVRPDTWTTNDAYVSGCNYYRLINYLHGYTYDADCLTGEPLAIRDWPLADPIHAAPVELQYGACEDSQGAMVEGNCYVVLATNNGVLHIFDAATGEETTGIIPAELWRPNTIANSTLSELHSQPSSRYIHRYYLDGVMKLLHDDQDFDGFINNGEKAWLMFSLGRGGRAYYALDVSTMADGIVDEDVNIYPLLATSGTPYEDMEETWASPVLAQMNVGSQTKLVGVFPSGHYPFFDFAERTEALEEQIGFEDESVTGEVRTVSCTGTGGLAEFNGYGTTGLCADEYTPSCDATPSSPCYDGSGLPLDNVTQPLVYHDGIHVPSAMRLYFSHFDLGPGDSLRLLDDQGQLVATYTGQSLHGMWSDWVYRPGLTVQLVTDGQDSVHEGFVIGQMQWEVGFERALNEPSSYPEPVLGVDHKPAIFFVDTAKWNGSTPQAMAATTDDEGLVLKVAKECSSLGSRCLDHQQAPDLNYMVCPISGAPAPYLEDGRIAALYFGDECGQLFKVFTDDGGLSWSARRLVNVNQGQLAVTKDHRKIFSRLDVVESLCPGEPVVGVYFGTGNVQRPLASDELEDGSVTNGRDIVGVLWDNGNLGDDLTQDDFVDVSSSAAIDPVSIYGSGYVGWLLYLNERERMLRDPLVVDGIAYFKTFQPHSEVSACSLTVGQDRIYAVNNCTAAAVAQSSSVGGDDRVAWSGTSVMATALTLLAPKNGTPFVVHGDMMSTQQASVAPPRSTRPGIYLWREMP